MADNVDEMPVEAEDPDVLPLPADGNEQDWAERRRVAVQAWELGRKLMTPKPTRPVPPPRLAARKRRPAR